MTVYYSDALERDELLSRAFSLCGIAPTVVRTAGGKPRLADGAAFFNLTHSGGLCAVAIASQEVGLDAERRRELHADALLSRLTPAERREDFFTLWTAKEAYVKFKGSALARELPRLEYREGTLYEDGSPVPVRLAHFEREGAVFCVCTAREEEVSFVRLRPLPSPSVRV